MDGVPIKVKIGLRPNGHADHPDWTILPLVAGGATKEDRENLVRAHQIERWKYDNTSGHEDDTADSPKGMQWGMMIVTKEFAEQAMAQWPTLVFEMTEAEAEDFWNNRAMAGVPRFKYDTDQLIGMKAERDLRIALAQDTKELDQRIAVALDPATKVPGVRERRETVWSQHKEDSKLTVIGTKKIAPK